MHAATQVGNPATQLTFLARLKELIPAICKQVIIVTDAGFVTPWFSAVKAMGWDYVGRVRGKIHYRLADEKIWYSVNTLHTQKPHKPRYRGEGKLGQRTKTSIACHFIKYKAASKGRKNKKRKGLPFYPAKEQQHKKAATETWVIVTSLCYTKRVTAQMILIYKKRMQIEQNFRDDKSHRYGFGWRYSRCKNILRINTLCLIAAIATLSLWLIGFLVEQKKWHYAFQANTVKNKRTLSFLFLAKEILQDDNYRKLVEWRDLKVALQLFQQQYAHS